jgi:WD40 repeat protein
MNEDAEETSEFRPAGPRGESPSVKPGGQAESEVNEAAPLGASGFRVDARGVGAVQVGEGNTQINYSYTLDSLWTDHVAPPPLVGISGVVESPYRGLGAFEERDAAFFYGRELATTELMDRLDQAAQSSGFVVVSGVSGAGKSSLLRAGVLPRIRGTGLPAAPGPGRWECLLAVPTRSPLDELAVRMAVLAGTDAAQLREVLDHSPERFALTARQASAVRGASGRLLVVIDQFERLFTQCPDEDQRRRFIAALHAVARAAEPTAQPGAVVVLVVRADYEARCADYPELSGAVQDRYLVTAMTDRQLRLTITEPAKAIGSSVDDDLVEGLVREIKARPPGASASGPAVSSAAGILPLLSYALDRAWRSRTSRDLPLSPVDYERVGGIEGAVAAGAQSVYEALSPERQVISRRIFVRLTTTTDEGVDSCDRVPRAELTDGLDETGTAHVQAVLEAFAEARLVTLSSDSAEISHEALLRAWPLLRDEWLAQTHSDRLTRARLRITAREWAADHDSSFLYRGNLLNAATEAVHRVERGYGGMNSLSPPERSFLEASTLAQRKSVRRRRTLITGLITLIVAFASATTVASIAEHDALRQQIIAVADQLGNESQAYSSSAPDIAALAGLQAWRTDPSAENRYDLLKAALLPQTEAVTHGDEPGAVAFGSNSNVMAIAGGNGTAVWNTSPDSRIDVLPHSRSPYAVAVGGDGALVAFGENGQIVLWSTRTRREILSVKDSAYPGYYGDNYNDSDDDYWIASGATGPLALSANGELLAAGDDNGVGVWNAVTGVKLGEIYTYGDVQALAFSPDGRSLAVGDDNFGAAIYNTANGKQVSRIAQAADSLFGVEELAFSPNGKELALDETDLMVLWNVADGKEINSLINSTYINSLAFSMDGSLIAMADDSGTLLYSTINGQVVADLGDPGEPAEVGFSSNGRYLLTADDAGMLQRWSMAPYAPIGTVTANSKNAQLMAYDVPARLAIFDNGKAGVSAGVAGAIRPSQKLDDPDSNVAIFGPGGRTVAIGDDAGDIRIWNPRTGVLLETLPGPSIGVSSVKSAAAGKRQVAGLSYSSNGDELAVCYENGTILIWNTGTRRVIASRQAGSAGSDGDCPIALSPDGRTLVIGSAPSTLLWSVTASRPIAQLSQNNTASIVFSRDGDQVIIGNVQGIGIFEASSGRLEAELEQRGGIESLALSPDGTILAAEGFDGTILWDLTTQQRLFELPTQTFGAESFTTDGRSLIAISAPDIKTWDTSYLVDTVADVCTVAASATPASWQEYSGSIPYPGRCH